MMIRKYSTKELTFLREFIPGHSEREIIAAFAEQFNFILTEGRIGNIKKKLGVKSGTVGGRFTKGQAPPNKGKKWAEFMSLEGMANSRLTQFKKGQVSHNTLPIGTERITKDGYIEIRTAIPKVYDYGERQQKQFYRLKHRVIWEAANGPIPESHAIIFLDKNPLNCVLENLELVSRADLARINQFGLFVEDPELNKTACLIAKLKTATGRASKKKNKCTKKN